MQGYDAKCHIALMVNGAGWITLWQFFFYVRWKTEKETGELACGHS